LLKTELTILVYALRAKHSQHLPTVHSKNEMNQMLDGVQGLHQPMVRLLYGCVLRLTECPRLWVKDIVFEQCQIVFRTGKGKIDSLMMLPACIL
jgi:site-specific recombinase XerD